MAVFQLSIDETTTDTGQFVHGGFIAPAPDWSDWFAPVWEDRVLRGLPYFHMVEMRSPRWRRDHGLTWIEADRRIEAAVDVVSTLGSLAPVSCEIGTPVFQELLGHLEVVPETPQPSRFPFEPDYLTFLGMCLNALEWAYRSDAEKVDFVVEKKQKVTRRMQHFFEGLPKTFEELEKPHYIKLLGGLRPVAKDHVPVQAADLLCWHLQRRRSNECERADYRRFQRMTERAGVLSGFSDDDIKALRHRHDAAPPVPNPFAAKIRRSESPE